MAGIPAKTKVNTARLRVEMGTRPLGPEPLPAEVISQATSSGKLVSPFRLDSRSWGLVEIGNPVDKRYGVRRINYSLSRSPTNYRLLWKMPTSSNRPNCRRRNWQS